MTLDELIADVNAQTPDGTALDHLEDSTRVAARLDELADHLVGHFVDQARRAGASWAAIGERLGVTKQAAQQRFVVGEISMEHFTNRAAVAVLKAQNNARNGGHEAVTSLHLVLGLLDEWDALAGQAIEAGGVTEAAVRAAVEGALPPSGPPQAYHVDFSAGTNKVLTLATREALRLGHNYVGTEHILLGMLEADEEPGAGVLLALGVSKPAVEAWTLHATDELRRSRASVART